MSAPRAIVIAAPGTNRDADVTEALELAGASVERLGMRTLQESPDRLLDAQIAVLAGGFSHADALGAGTVWANDVQTHLADGLRALVERGGLLLGICNGFQALVRTGLLPGSLAHNAGGSFVCRWVEIVPTGVPCAWTTGWADAVACPVAHGEGRYVADDATCASSGALRYGSGTDPNGSAHNVAGVTDATGRILGLMPHPENHIVARQHPRHHRGAAAGLGLDLFTAGVRHVRAV